MENPTDWIRGDETARNFLSRVLTERPYLLLPPLHRVPLRAGNVVEIAGPSPSGKTEILLQAAINCILPREWKGVHVGGLERMVMYFDLDCRFDVLRLSNALKIRIMEALGSKKDVLGATQLPCLFDDELFLASMRRFLYIRCYSTMEFLSALKTVHYQFKKESEALGISAQFIMIDSIGAFQWIDRASQPLPQSGNKRRTLSLQNLADNAVHELRNLLQMQPLLVLAAKATIFGSGIARHGSVRAPEKWSTEDMANLRTSRSNYRDYMPSAWQSVVTHRVHLGISEVNSGEYPTYTSEWIQPPLNVLDKFTVKDNGICMVS